MAVDRFTLDPSIRALLHDLGIPAGAVLRRAQLPGGLFGAGPVALTPDEYFRFWDALDVEAHDPDLAVKIGQAISVEMFSPPIFAALCSPNLGIAAQRIAVYKPLVGPLAIDVAKRTTGLTVTYRWPGNLVPPALLSTIELAFWVALARIGTRHDIRAARVTSAQVPTNLGSVTDYFGVRIRRGPNESITFATEDAARPFLTEHDAMWRVFAPELRRRLADLQATATAVERVRAALHETLPAGDGTMTGVASQLATSPRTLPRQLQVEGTTFQAVLADTRQQLARHYLAQRTMSTAEIAYLLAYDDANAYDRAVRAWTGSTPDRIRATTAAGTAGRAD
jgi:AraC-like DNA-binding protein